MKIGDAIAGAILLAVALAVLLQAQGFPAIPGQRYGAGAFPTLVALGLGACGLLLLWGGIKARQRLGWLEPWARNPRLLGGFALTFALILFYILAADRLGFIPVGVIMLTALIVPLGGRVVTAVPLAIGATLAIHYAFGTLLRVPLPRGLLGLG